MPGGKRRPEPARPGSTPPSCGALVLGAAGAAPTVVQGEDEVAAEGGVREAPMSLAAAPWPGARSWLASCWVALAPVIVVVLVEVREDEDEAGRCTFLAATEGAPAGCFLGARVGCTWGSGAGGSLGGLM